MVQVQTFKDLNVTFKSHPVTGDLIVSKNEAAIKQAVTNLLLTNKGERFFNNQLGSSISTFLFEPLDVGTATIINSNITEVLKKYEPRIKIIALDTTPNYDDNGFDVQLDFEIIGREDGTFSINFFLERTR